MACDYRVMADGPRIGLVETEAVSCVCYELQIEINISSDSVQSEKKKKKKIATLLLPIFFQWALQLIYH